MVIYRSATFDDVEKLHKLLNDYAAEGLCCRVRVIPSMKICAITWWPLRTIM